MGSPVDRKGLLLNDILRVPCDFICKIRDWASKLYVWALTMGTCKLSWERKAVRGNLTISTDFAGCANLTTPRSNGVTGHLGMR